MNIKHGVKKKKKKNRKLLFQIGSVTLFYSLLLILVFSALIYVVGIYAYVKAKEDQVTDNLRRLNERLFDEESMGDFLNERILDYMQEHPEVAGETLLADPFFEEDPKRVEFYDALDSWRQKGGTESEFYQILRDDQLGVAAQNGYRIMFYELMSEQEAFGHRQLALLNINEDKGNILFMADNRKSYRMMDYWEDPLPWAESYIQEYHLGEAWDDISEHEELAKLLQDQGQEPVFELSWKQDGDEYITGYFPVILQGKIRYILLISYEWAEFQDAMLASASQMSRICFMAIIISEALLLIFVYLKAVRPLRKVKNSLNRYIESKDSDTVVKEMESVKQRNEFGLLADDIATMVREIDRYNSENMELAGEREKASTELELAARIQNGMLRRDFANTPEYELFALMDPAKEVGGDFYDFFELDNNHIALVIADVAGKGVPGSLFMMSALSVIREKTMAGVSPAEILTQVNHELVKGDFGDMFVTVWLGIMDLESGILTAANAGHEYPVLKTGDHFELLKDKHGFVVGGMEGVTYQDYQIDLSQGGTIFVYTDGVPEATAADDELYGTDRLLEALNLYPDETPEKLAKNVKLDVDLFVGEAEQFDDLTILSFRYTPSAFRK